MKLRDTNWGIGYQHGNVIELNPILLKYPLLRKMILEHEKEHMKNPNARFDFKTEFKDAFDFKKMKLMNKFMIRHPIISLQAMCPVWIHKGQFNYNSYLIALYSLFILSIGSMILI